MSFTIAEKSLIYLYYYGSRTETAYELRNALRYIDDEECRVAEDALDKLEAMSDRDFSALVRDWGLD